MDINPCPHRRALRLASTALAALLPASCDGLETEESSPTSEAAATAAGPSEPRAPSPLGTLADPIAPAAFGGINPAIDQLFDDVPIVDGLLEPSRAASLAGYRTLDYTRITEDTGANVIVGKIASARCDPAESRPCDDDGYANHVARYAQLKLNPNLHVVHDAGDLSCADVYDTTPELLFYYQKPWRIDFGADPAEDAESAVRDWYDQGLRVLQLAYSTTANADFYAPGEHYGAGPGSADGLTVYGRLVADEAMRRGIILDVSHMSDPSVEEITDMAIARAQAIGRPVPVLANHRNVREQCASCTYPDRNLTLDMACQVAATGGTIGLTPIATTMLDAGATFADLIDHIDALTAHTCSIDAWDGRPIDLIDHISVATDAGRRGTSTTRDGGPNPFYLDQEASSVDRWRILATEMLDHRGYALDELRRIFGANLLRALRSGLRGSLPFGEVACGYGGGQFELADVNGDGLDDAVYHSSSGGTWIDHATSPGGALDGVDWARESAPDDVDPSWCAIGGPYTLLVGDVNGDGREDMVCHHHDGRTWIDYASGTGRFYGTNWSRTGDAAAADSWCPTGPAQTLRLGDVNGDGRDDLICHHGSGRTYIDYADASGRFRGQDWSRTGDDLADDAWCAVSGSRSLYVGDVNGDGRDDLVCHGDDGQTWVDLADPSGRFRGTNWSRAGDAAADDSWCATSGSLSVYFGDVNGDGRDDLVCHSAGSGRTWIDFADASGRFRGTNRSSTDAFCRASDGGSLRVGHRNGDDRADLACFVPETGALFERFGSGAGFTDTL